MSDKWIVENEISYFVVDFKGLIRVFVVSYQDSLKLYRVLKDRIKSK